VKEVVSIVAAEKYSEESFMELIYSYCCTTPQSLLPTLLTYKPQLKQYNIKTLYAFIFM